MSSRVKLNIINRSGTCAGTLRHRHFLFINGWRIMSPRIEVCKLIHSVENVRDELFEKNPRRDTSSPAKPASDRASKICKISVINDRPDAGALDRLLCKKVANPRAYLHQGIEIKPGKPYLNGARIVEAGISGEVRVNPLG